MSLKNLIKNQTIIIDDHKRGNGEIKNWDDPAADIHIDKTTNYPINGKKQKVRIRIPINSNRPIKIQNSRRHNLKDIPGQLEREIKQAFEDKTIRLRFITELISILKSYKTILDSETQVQQILKTLSQHFNLNWTERKIATYTNEILQVYTQTYSDSDGRAFFITVDRNKIKIGETTSHVRHQININKNY